MTDNNRAGHDIKLRTIKINGETASVRTRRIVKRSGPEFEIQIRNEESKRVLVKSPKGYSGWLPLREIIIK